MLLCPNRQQVLLWLSLLSAASVTAQQPQPGAVFRTRVEAIEIEMRAVNGDGAPITDLDQSEVEVFEDGRQQPIVAFSRVTVPRNMQIKRDSVRTAIASTDVASNRHVGASRIFVLILDDLHVDKRNTVHVKQAARRFVEHHLEKEDLVSVVYTGNRPDAVQDFTSDRRLLLEAIDKFIGRKLPSATIERMEQYEALYRARGRPRFQDLRDPHDAERAFNARSSMASIEVVANVLARVTGRRKAALLFSEGLDYDLAGLRTRGGIPGPPLGPTALPITAPTGGSESEALGRVEAQNYSDSVLLALQAAMGAASRANVVLYPVDVQGGNTSDSQADLGAAAEDPSLGLNARHVNQEMRDAQETLVTLAENTGGFATLTPSNYDAAFSRIAADSSEYYLLAYSPPNPAPDGTYRDIAVRVNRPGVRVMARRGYYAPRQPAKSPVRFVGRGISPDTSSLVMAPIPVSGLLLDLNAVNFKRDRRRTEVVVTAHVEGSQLADTTRARDVDNSIELALIAVDSLGKVHAATAREIEVRLDQDATSLMRQAGYRVISRIQVPPGRYQIRQAARERNGGRQGMAFVDLVVPDYSSRLDLSDILLTSTQSNIVPTAVDADTYRHLPILPSVRRNFSSEDELIALVEVYNTVRTRQVEVITTLHDEHGQERYRRRSTIGRIDFDPARGAYRHSVQIPLKEVQGDVVLSIEAKPLEGSRETVTRRVMFGVSPSPG